MTTVHAPVFTQTLVRRIGRLVQTVARWPKASAVAIVIVGDRRMRKLNHAYRGVDEVTDVLTFRYSRTAGDVVICYPQARRQAKAKQTSLRRECAWLVIHGLLHWLGYDHETAADANRMRPLEQRLLAYGQF